MTEKQLEIVNHIDGSLLVTAGPGSGKTRVLTERIIQLLNLNKKRILALTFSNKAAEEITERLKLGVEEDRFENVFVGTIHSFCLDVVMNRGNLIGLPSGLTLFENDADRIEILKRVFAEMPDIGEFMDENRDKRNLLKNCLNKISKLKQAYISPEVLSDSQIESDILFARIYEAYNNMMLAQKALDFDDILFYSYRIFTERPQIAKSYTRLYKYIFVDEAQDLNEAQYKIIRALCKDFSNLMMVGDPAQSIYGFNGSDSSYMTENFKSEFNPVEYNLVENFRSTKKIIDAAKKIQVNSKSSVVYPLEGELSIIPLENEEEEAEWIKDKVNELLINGNEWIEGAVELEKIGIIARNRYIFNSIEENFKKNDIAYNYGSSSRSVESESAEMKIFEAGLRVIINPYDNVHFNQIINLLHYKCDVKNNRFLDTMLEIDVDMVTNVDKEIFKAVKNSWGILIEDEEGFTKALTEISNVLFSQTQSGDLDEGSQYLINKDIEMWREHWIRYCGQTVVGQRSFSHFRNQVALGRTQMHNSKGISLLTVHMSKGLEYDIVFLVGMCEGTFPDYRATNEQSYNEELNNMFVALTRAKRICYLTYPKYKLMPWGKLKYQSPSRFLKIISDEY
ncbi:ATP-dependent helicase [Lysinibacillus capsici]|nr:ATP-dependent helicase [Lysinibacillus capsici]MEC1305982.1 ATP-dependent helicase [Lysinibacillus capsici]